MLEQAREQNIQTNLVTVRCRIWGDAGPKIVLLHGFPETPHVFDELASILVARGYQVFAPFLPGYCGTDSLGNDKGIVFLPQIAECLTQFCECVREQEEKLILLGHDWGAVAAYVCAASAPGLYQRLIAMAVPPLPAFLKSLIFVPSQLVRSSYMLAFQFRMGFAEWYWSRNEHQKLRALCLKWCGGHPVSSAFFSRAEAFDSFDDLKPSLGYYRGLIPLLNGDSKAWKQAIRLAYQPIEVPTKILVGALDDCIPEVAYRGFEWQFPKGCQFEVVPEAGHFLPLDVPEYLANIVSAA